MLYEIGGGLIVSNMNRLLLGLILFIILMKFDSVINLICVWKFWDKLCIN